MTDLDIKPYDAADYLTDPERIVGYLREAIATGDAATIQLAFDAAERAAKAIKRGPIPARPGDEEQDGMIT